MRMGIDRYQHGGGIIGLARERGVAVEALLDFSASINPLGMPPAALAAAREALPLAVHYPEIDAASLRLALARHHRLAPEQILPGSGSTELLYLFPQVFRPRRALVVTPAFSEYGRSLTLAGAAVDTFPLYPGQGFRLDPEALIRRLTPETDLVLLANPGNPTGIGIEPQKIENLAAALAKRAYLAVDEAFVDFAPQRSVLDRIGRHDNLFVFRSLTKFYALPGLRIGFVAGPAEAIARLAAARSPWPLSTPALAAAAACLEADDYRRQTLETVPQWRRQLQEELEVLGLTVFAGEANYLLTRREDGGSAAELATALSERGILVRDCSNFPPLDGRYLRLAVRPPAETGDLLAELAHLLLCPSASPGSR